MTARSSGAGCRSISCNRSGRTALRYSSASAGGPATDKAVKPSIQSRQMNREQSPAAAAGDRRVVAFASGTLIGALGGLIGLGGAEFRLPLLIGLWPLRVAGQPDEFLRSLPSTGVTRLPRYYEPLRHPRAPGLSLTGFRLVLADHALGLPVFRTLSLCTCCRHYPGAASGRTASLTSPSRISLPR